ncbi:MAG: hypothetical protein ACLVEV_03885 [Lachnospiraceae bacterium]
MNVLEKILKEIDKAEENYCNEKLSPMYLKGVCSMYADAKQIIRSHMDEVNNNGWIPISKRLPKPYEIVWVTVYSSEWISDYGHDWVPEEEKIHHEEKYSTARGLMDGLGDWTFLDENGDSIKSDKRFGADKGEEYNVVIAWMPRECIKPYRMAGD